MDERELVRAPGWTTIVVEQIRLVGLRFRATGAWLLVVGTLVGAAFVWVLHTVGAGLIASRAIALANHALSAQARAKLAVPLSPMSVSFAPEISATILPIALLLPLAMWVDEPPGRRDYHLVMPMSASTHTLMRVLAGWCWVMVATALILLAEAAVPAIVGWFPGALPVRTLTMAWWEWLVPFTAVTIGYIFASAAAVGARRPIVWLGGGVILYLGAVALLITLRMHDEAATLFKGVAGYYGAAAAMGGQVSWTAGAPVVGRWLGATSLWGLGGAALLLAVARRRAEG